MTFFKTLCSNFLVDKTTTDQKLIIDNFQNDTKAFDCDDVCHNLMKDIKFVNQDTTLGHDVFRDVEMFQNIDDSYVKTKTVFDVLDDHLTIGGKVVTRRMLNTPLKNIKILKNRQNILKDMEEKPNLDFDKLKELEKDVLWLYADLDQNLEDVYNIVYFRASFLKNLNNYGSVLTGWNLYKIVASPLIGILSPIVYFIIPFCIVRYKFPQIKLSLKTYLKLMYQMVMNSDMMFGDIGNYKSIRLISYLFSLIFYFQGIFNSVEISKTLYKMSNYLTSKINNVIEFLQLAKDFIAKYWTEKIIGSVILADMFTVLPQDEENKYIDSLKIKDFSLMTNFGENLKVYKTINKEVISSVLYKTYIIDSLLSIVKTKTRLGLSYTNYLSSDKPVIKVDGLWHICLDKENVVSNDIALGGNEQYENTETSSNERHRPQNAIITGPNAGGKSTCVKSFLINILLSQTMCVSSATKCEMTPMHYINSQISIPDCKGHESLFQAELYRCKNNLDVLKALKPDEFAFITMDEIFNSTNVIEGIAGAYAIAKKLSNYDNMMLIFTTHFSYLTKLAKDNKKFENLKMNVEINPITQEIKFPYKLSKGISKQYIALELLKQKGFDEDILEEAIAIKKRFE